MFARVNEFKGTFVQLDAEARQAEEIAGRVDATPGSLGRYYLVDREGGKALAITLWEDEAAMRASEEKAAGIREESSQTAGTQVLGVGRCEVVVNTARVPSMTE